MNIKKRYSNYLRAAKAITLGLSFTCLLLPFSAFPQQNNHKLSVSPPAQVVVKRGGTATATVTVSTLPGFHVNSDKPKDEFLIPFRLAWDPSAFQMGPVMYPAAEQVQVGADQLSVFTGTFSLKTQLSAPANAPTGGNFITGKLHYQACNNRMCFRPETIEVKIPVLVE